MYKLSNSPNDFDYIHCTAYCCLFLTYDVSAMCNVNSVLVHLRLMYRMALLRFMHILGALKFAVSALIRQVCIPRRGLPAVLLLDAMMNSGLLVRCLERL